MVAKMKFIALTALIVGNKKMINAPSATQRK